MEVVSPDARSLSALLSQLLVAFTVELDNEFERRMGEAGYPGARLSWVVWTDLMRFLARGAVSVRDLPANSADPDKQPKFRLGCLERWGFVILETHQPEKRQRRDGWGSGRGIRADWMVRLSAKGASACEIWPPLAGLIERRWEQRFGNATISRLREALANISDKLAVPAQATHTGGHPTLPGLLSRLLSAFRLEFDPASPLPLTLCANTLRVLGEQPARLADLPRLTGASPEQSDIGWQLRPYVVVKPDPAARRGKVVHLSPRGLQAQQTYYRLIGEIELRWEAQVGRNALSELRKLMLELFDRRGKDGPLLSEGLVPPPGTVRAGDQAPALGRRDVGPAARQRARDLVAQTKAFIDDPAGTLPHFPPWDMNRGFGP
jgi:hypothetical protein